MREQPQETNLPALGLPCWSRWFVHAHSSCWARCPHAARAAVVYLDADTVVKQNIDDLFLCDGLCGVMRHSERLNTGVLALQVGRVPQFRLFWRF